MHTRKILLVFAILLVSIAVAIDILSISKRGIPQGEPDESVITYKIAYERTNFGISQEVEMEINGINIEGITILAVTGALVGIFSTLFWMFIVWRVLEKLSTSVDRLLQQKLSDEQDRET